MNVYEVTVWYKEHGETKKCKLINVIAHDAAEASRKARDFYSGYKVTATAPEQTDDLQTVDDYNAPENQR